MLRLRVLRSSSSLIARSFYACPKGQVPNWIDNKFVVSKSDAFTEHYNPATMKELLSKTPDTTPEEMEAAVASAKRAFQSWSKVPLSSRIRIIMKFMDLALKNQDALCDDVTTEHGKTTPDAHGEISRGLDILEHAATLSSRVMGGMMPNLSADVDTYSFSVPLGVTATIMPFNFPFMCPLWSVPLALAAGNTVILKPSERVPQSSMNIAKLFAEAGLPDGCLNVIHGAKRTVNFLCDHPDIRAISFVGSNQAGEHIYHRASATGKRVQCNMGAKNHIVIMPDADKETALNAMVGSAFGAAGQRCMANSVAVFVGEAKNWVPDLVDRARHLKVDEGHRPGAQLGPLITKQAKDRAIAITQAAVKEGARLALDGTALKVAGFEEGNFLGPTILTDVTPNMTCYQQEIFAPVFSTMNVPSLDDAIKVVNANMYGNGTAIVTSSGAAARKYQNEVECGQVGINVPIPVGLYFFGFTGWKKSFIGSHHFYGQDGVKFFTETKTVISHWKYEGSAEMQVTFPTNK